MKYNKLQSKPFWKKISCYRKIQENVPIAWHHELHNYIIHGFEPGGFHRQLYANNLFEATLYSDPFNEWKWKWIAGFMSFLADNAPFQCWGSEEKVKKWLALSDKKRLDICHEYELILLPEELTWDILKTSEDLSN